MSATLAEKKNAYSVAMENFEKAADELQLDDDVRNMIRYPERILCVNVPVRMDNGKIECFEGYRVQHTTMRGPVKGGIRFHPDVTLDEVRKSHVDLDDLEVRRGQHPLRWRQGWRHRATPGDVDGAG